MCPFQEMTAVTMWGEVLQNPSDQVEQIAQKSVNPHWHFTNTLEDENTALPSPVLEYSLDLSVLSRTCLDTAHWQRQGGEEADPLPHIPQPGHALI